MPYRLIEFVAGEYYHIYNRGNNYETIFLERENYLYFLRLVHKYLPPEQVEIVAYCLMPNHYHLLVYLQTGSFSKMMQPFLLAYTNAINRRYQRIGALFQGRFKGLHIGKNEYLLHLSRYIHLNPVKAGFVKKAEDWEFSSYREYIGLRHGVLPRPKVVLDQFGTPAEYRLFVEEELTAEISGFQELLFD
ncbi:MAG: transposase [Anaerolinea sp.]|nr:transposase [Anaerolinea sp.]